MQLVPPIGRVITITNNDGKSATIDYSGDTVKYSGDLPIDEAAKVFFDAVFKQFKPINR